MSGIEEMAQIFKIHILCDMHHFELFYNHSIIFKSTV